MQLKKPIDKMIAREALVPITELTLVGPPYLPSTVDRGCLAQSKMPQCEGFDNVLKDPAVAMPVHSTLYAQLT
jgi:hypothetical protein